MSICPKCQRELVVVTYDEKELLQCTDCQGFWFRNGLFREIKQRGFADLCPSAPPTTSSASDAPAEEPATLVCPDCAETLAAYNYAYSSDIQLHRCLKCKGIWATSQALLEIETLLVNYRESLDEAKAKAMPLMLEVKKHFERQEQAWEEERKRSRKGFFKKLFQKKDTGKPDLEQFIEELPPENNP